MTNIPIDITGDSHHHEPPQTWRTYLSFSTDHKVIGIQYLVTSFIFFLVGGIFAMILRGELITPEADLIDRTVYNGMFTMHGTVMLFLWTFPSLVGMANYLVPLMIGARDMAFPRLNAVAFWMVPVVGILLMSSFFVPGGPAQSGWWAYPPVSTQNPTGNLINGQVLWLLAVAISGVSSIMGAVNFVTTIVKMRSPGMGYFRMPLFVWAVFSAQIIQLFGLPALTAGAVMLLLDITVGTAFFDPTKGGNPVMFQHYFWFYSHPAVYVIILPIFGIFSEIFPVYSRKPLFGYKVVAISSMLIAVVSGIVWVHHMYVSGTPAWLRLFFMVTTMFVSIPTGIKVFAWVATIWGGKIRLTTPMLFALGGLVMFGTNLNFLPMHPLGLQGMLRRAASYAPELIGWNIVASLGSFLLGMSTLPFIFNMLISWIDGEKAPANPWRAIGLEWTVSSPPPVENFEEIPIVTCEPYGYGKPELMTFSEHE